MINEVIKIAKTIEEAIQQGCIELGHTTSEVSYEVVEMPKKGFLGFGSTPAKVRVYYEVSKAKTAVNYFKALLDNMGVTDYDIKVSENEKDNNINMVLEGDNLGIVIGRRGETLDAIQYLVSLVANRTDNKYTRITIDSGNYREKREKTLQSLAKKIAVNVVKTGRSSTLEPMNPYERRIIHAAVSQIEGATSTSIGDEPNRKVIISSLNAIAKKPVYNKDRRPINNGYKGKRYVGNDSKPYSKPVIPFEKKQMNSDVVVKQSSETDTQNLKQEDNKPLYSKIEI